ncbi:MAG: elongation factor G [Clostridiales bacterium]|nr:elongation factor G [Clostridiales bacterium]
MKQYETQKIRNIGLLGHGGQGKTTLAEAMLYTSGAIDRMGRIEDGNTITDFDAEEQKRGFSISAALAPVEWKDHKINVIDVPGYFDMVGEVAGPMRVIEGAVIVLGAAAGLDVGAEKAWGNCEAYSVARLFFVNQLDRENVSYSRVLDELKAKYGSGVVPIAWPILDGGFKGYVDILGGKAYLFEGKAVKETAIPDDLADTISEIRDGITEAAAGSDEELMEKFFEEGTLTGEEIIKGLREGVANGTVVPVLCGSALENKGTAALLDTLIGFIPSPGETTPARGVVPGTDKEVTRSAQDDQPLSAFVFKTVADPFVGRLSFIKVMSGTLAAGAAAENVAAGKNEKINHVYTMVGKRQLELDALRAGDIGALSKINANTGDTLCDPADKIQYPPVAFPEPCISFAVMAAKQGEEDKVFSGLARLQEEDPSFTIRKSAETGDTLLSGQGELHLTIITSKLMNKFRTQAVLTDPKIPYRETIRKTVNAQGRHKKQTGGHGQFGDVWIEFSPIVDGSADFEFVDRVVGGVVPRQYIPAVEKGLRECITRGVLAGYPVVNLRCALYDGSYHPVDSSEMAFKIAAHLAFKKGCADASPALLEPIDRVAVLVPDESMGDVIGDLNRRRGRIMGMNPKPGGLQEVLAEVPEAEMFKYATDLRSMTQARGSFTMTLERYEEVPPNIAQKVIEKAKKDLEEEE